MVLSILVDMHAHCQMNISKRYCQMISPAWCTICACKQVAQVDAESQTAHQQATTFIME